jgi:hypothetical protein
MNPEGVVLRRFPVRASVNANRGMEWSPDGQRLMYSVPGSGIHVVDMTTGAESDLPTGGGSRPLWRSDSRAVLFGTLAGELRPDSLTPVAVREMDLGGADKVLRTFAVPCRPADCDIKVISDSLAVTWQAGEYRAIPLRHSGPPRVVYTRQGTGQPVPTFSHNGQWMAVRVAVQGERLPRRIDVMRID